MNSQTITPFDTDFFDSSAIEPENTLLSTDVFDTEVINDPEKLEDLSVEWNALLNISNVNNVFLTYEWCSTWWKHFGNEAQLCLVTLRHPTTRQLLGLAPMAITEQRAVPGLTNRHLIFLGNGAAAADHLDFILHPDYETELTLALIDYLWSSQSQWNAIDFEGMVATSAIVYGLLQQHPQLMKLIERTICPYLKLPATWEEYNQSLSRTMRYNMGRFQRKLMKDYPAVTNIKQHDSIAELNTFMPDLFNLHSIAQQRLGNTGIFKDQTMKNFHQELAIIFSENNWLRAYSLDIGDTSIAALYCFHYNNTVYFYQSGFDTFWRRYSPGTQIMAHAIKTAIEENAHTFDFLRGEENYKFEWTKSYKTNLSYVIPFGIQKQIELMIKQTRNRLKRHVQLTNM